MVKMPKCMSWLDAYNEPIGDLDMMEDKVDNASPQSTPQVLPSFEVYTPPVTYSKEVEETIRISMESLNVVNEVVYHSPVDFTLAIVVLVFDLQVIFDEEKPESS
ncbi:hypothetical protein Tco_0777881 [Tanacetum coccineum]